MHNSRNRISLGFSLSSLLMGAIGSLMGQPHEVLPQKPAASAGPDLDAGRGGYRYRGTPYSATDEDKAERFRKLKSTCRPPARRFYAPMRPIRGPVDMPKRMKDRRKWRKAKGYTERAITRPCY